MLILGKEKPPKLIAGIIVGRRNATFLRLLYESYKNNYRWWDWDYNCARIAYQLYLKRPDLLHVEPYRLTTPDWTERRKLWNDVIDWSDLYVVHVMAHFEHSDEVYTPENIRRVNTTFGQIMRYVYYGSPEMITSWHHLIQHRSLHTRSRGCNSKSDADWLRIWRVPHVFFIGCMKSPKQWPKMRSWADCHIAEKWRLTKRLGQAVAFTSSFRMEIVHLESPKKFMFLISFACYLFRLGVAARTQKWYVITSSIIYMGISNVFVTRQVSKNKVPNISANVTIAYADDGRERISHEETETTRHLCRNLSPRETRDCHRQWLHNEINSIVRSDFVAVVRSCNTDVQMSEVTTCWRWQRWQKIYKCVINDAA